MHKYVKFAVAASFALVPAQAIANVTGNIEFSGSVTHTCTITVNSAGTFGVSTDFKTLASNQASGTAGSATISASGNGFDIGVDAPSLSKPTFDTTAETLTASYSTTGATSVSGSNTSADNDLANGTTNVSVHMSAVKSGSDVFEAGNYTGTVVLRCE